MIPAIVLEKSIHYGPTGLFKVYTLAVAIIDFQAVEGETNPRNLHLIFGIWPLVMAHFELAEYSEDVFELFSCYFPIDFNPSKVGHHGLQGFMTNYDNQSNHNAVKT